MEGKIFVVNSETGKGEWLDKAKYFASKASAGVSAAVYGDIEPYEGIGFPGQPLVTGRAHHRELLRQNPHLAEVGGEGRVSRSRRT